MYEENYMNYHGISHIFLDVILITNFRTLGKEVEAYEKWTKVMPAVWGNR